MSCLQGDRSSVHGVWCGLIWCDVVTTVVTTVCVGFEDQGLNCVHKVPVFLREATGSSVLSVGLRYQALALQASHGDSQCLRALRQLFSAVSKTVSVS